MAYELLWLVEKRVLLARFLGMVDVETITNFIEEQHAMIAQGIPLVHHINDTTDTDRIEVSLRTLQAFMKTLKPPEGLGWHVEVNPHAFNRMISSLALQFAGARYRTVTTINEAITFLQANDDTLPQMKNPYQHDEIPRESR